MGQRTRGASGPEQRVEPALAAGTTRTAVAAGLGCMVLLLACGGEAKAPGTCPEGTMLKGADCVPTDSKSADDDSSASTAAAGGGAGASTGTSTSTASGAGDDSSTPPAAGGTPYDKDAVDVQLKRAARQIKGNCGSATDSDGKASGPWGSTKVTVTIGRNGHIKQVAVPAPYDGKPVGDCIVHAFQKGQFPPYAASSDATVEWGVELVRPK